VPYDIDLELLLREALREQPKRPKERRSGRSDSSISNDYALRLSEKALYRRLLADPLQDAERFVWWFSHQGAMGLSLEDWRRRIDFKRNYPDDSARQIPITFSPPGGDPSSSKA